VSKIIRETDLLPDAEAQILPEYSGQVYFTDCTCRARLPAQTKVAGVRFRVCGNCGSSRVNTGT
jgi:hypothetical protein